MTLNAERFSGRVAQYEQYDPAVVLPLLQEWCGLIPEWTVADVGAGTGMLSDVFLANGNRVIAVEPNAEMRAACARSHAGDRALAVMDGTAETTGLGHASVEMVSVGRALHWFDAEAAFAKFKRVLKPAGWVAVIAFGRAEDGREENVAFERTIETLMPARGRKKASGAYERIEDAFDGGEFRHAEIRGEMSLGWEALLGMAVSHAPLPGGAARQHFYPLLRPSTKLSTYSAVSTSIATSRLQIV
ncbi:MAG TPA: class I SAM-dependent methyltransferase [Acidobacteriaceae bacterium]|nr:class I SAM-dependent methyltransferase [Acidobacteriaceae bacterium]